LHVFLRYLGDDMLFYIASPLLTACFVLNKCLGVTLPILMSLVSIFASLHYAKAKGWSFNFYDGTDYYQWYYKPPWSRCPAYLIGHLFGLFYHEYCSATPRSFLATLRSALREPRSATNSARSTAISPPPAAPNLGQSDETSRGAAAIGRNQKVRVVVQAVLVGLVSVVGGLCVYGPRRAYTSAPSTLSRSSAYLCFPNSFFCCLLLREKLALRIIHFLRFVCFPFAPFRTFWRAPALLILSRLATECRFGFALCFCPPCPTETRMPHL
jgi:hypothetical protein